MGLERRLLLMRIGRDQLVALDGRALQKVGGDREPHPTFDGVMGVDAQRHQEHRHALVGIGDRRRQQGQRNLAAVADAQFQPGDTVGCVGWVGDLEVDGERSLPVDVGDLGVDEAEIQPGRATGLTTTTDDDRLVPAVRLLRPDQHQVTPEKTFEESAWAQTDEAAWRAVWDAEVAATDPWRTRRLTLATGLLLPIWGRLPSKGCSVRRVRAPDGRRWLGRVLDEVQAASLKTALGLTEVGDAWADGGRTAAAVLDRNVQLALSGGLWLKRSRVMDRWRLEVVGGRTDRDALVSLGCFVEIIAYAPRVFVPVDRPDVVEGVLRRHPVQSILEGAAA